MCNRHALDISNVQDGATLVGTGIWYACCCFKIVVGVVCSTGLFLDPVFHLILKFFINNFKILKLNYIDFKYN